MINEYEELKNILRELNYLEEAKKHIPIVKQKSKNKDSNVIGKKFRMLTVIDKTDRKSKSGRLLYKCKCDCGNIVYYDIGDIRKNTSCGCWKNSKGRIDNMMKSMKCFENTSIRVLENRRINKNNTSGHCGVSFSKSKNKWVAYIKVQRKNINLGTFSTKEEAIKARINGEEKYFKPLIDKYNNNTIP